MNVPKWFFGTPAGMVIAMISLSAIIGFFGPPLSQWAKRTFALPDGSAEILVIAMILVGAVWLAAVLVPRLPAKY